MDIFLLPFTNTPQRFEIELSGRGYIVQCRWNAQGRYWFVDFADADTSEWLFMGLPLVAGVDILQQYRHLVQGQIFIYTDGDANAPPTFENLGKEGNVYYLP